MEPVELSSPRLRLRPWRPADVPALVAACQDPLLRRHTLIPRPYGDGEGRTFVCEHSPSAWSAGTGAPFAAVSPAGELLGSTGLTTIEPVHARAEVGYWTTAAARGRGVATEALDLVARWAFGELGLARLVLLAEPGNVASCRVAEKVGFVREGLLRSSAVIDGERRDTVVYGLLPSDL